MPYIDLDKIKWRYLPMPVIGDLFVTKSELMAAITDDDGNPMETAVDTQSSSTYRVDLPGYDPMDGDDDA